MCACVSKIPASAQSAANWCKICCCSRKSGVASTNQLCPASRSTNPRHAVNRRCAGSLRARLQLLQSQSRPAAHQRPGRCQAIWLQQQSRPCPESTAETPPARPGRGADAARYDFRGNSGSLRESSGGANLACIDLFRATWKSTARQPGHIKPKTEPLQSSSGSVFITISPRLPDQSLLNLKETFTLAR